MTERMKKVATNHANGYNCAQAVACAYSDAFGMSEKDTFRSIEAFGRGMGIQGPCGVLSAMAYLAGLKTSDGNLEAPASKENSYNAFVEMHTAFTQNHQCQHLCSELKGENGECAGYMMEAAELVEKFLISPETK